MAIRAPSWSDETTKDASSRGGAGQGNLFISPFFYILFPPPRPPQEVTKALVKGSLRGLGSTFKDPFRHHSKDKEKEEDHMGE